MNVSLWNVENDTNAFPGDTGNKELQMSDTACHFIGGMLKHAEATCAVMCPTINSYKR